MGTSITPIGMGMRAADVSNNIGDYITDYPFSISCWSKPDGPPRILPNNDNE